MASADGDTEQLIDVQNEIIELRVTVTELIGTVGRLTTYVAG